MRTSVTYRSAPDQEVVETVLDLDAGEILSTRRLSIQEAVWKIEALSKEIAGSLRIDQVERAGR